jgi:hypothetical protein
VEDVRALVGENLGHMADLFPAGVHRCVARHDQIGDRLSEVVH